MSLKKTEKLTGWSLHQISNKKDLFVQLSIGKLNVCTFYENVSIMKSWEFQTKFSTLALSTDVSNLIKFPQKFRQNMCLV